MPSHSEEFKPLKAVVLTISDTRNAATDTSGDLLSQRLTDAGHQLLEKRIVKDNIYQIRAVVSEWIFQAEVQVILISGGTGFTQRDDTPQAITPLLDKTVDGFGELFRHISYQEIGTSTVQSRALAGLANGTLVVCMPGSPNACKTAWDHILQHQLDNRHKPCNFYMHLASAQH